MCQATISLLPKPGNDHSQMINSCLISMLNNDYKLFAKILAMHIKTVISSLIHLDQVVFIKGWLDSNNMRRLFHVMARAGTLQLPAIAISLDAEKAFDRVEWQNLFYVLSKFGIGPVSIQSKLMAVYLNPKNPRSIRQGCPASPSLFIPWTPGRCYTSREGNHWYPYWGV